MIAPVADCDFAYDGSEAVDVVRLALEDQNPYELICLDIMMARHGWPRGPFGNSRIGGQERDSLHGRSQGRDDHGPARLEALYPVISRRLRVLRQQAQ